MSICSQKDFASKRVYSETVYSILKIKYIIE